MALFESYERRIKQINEALNKNGISSIEEAKKICDDKGIDVAEIVKGVQPICFENACWAYIVGAAIAIKQGKTTAVEAAKAIGDDDGGDDVDDEAAADTADGEDGPDQTDQGGIQVEIFSDSSADTADHAVRWGFG